MAASDALASEFAKHHSIGAGGNLQWVKIDDTDPLEAEFANHYALGGDNKLLWVEDFAALGGRGAGGGAAAPAGGGGAASAASAAAPAPLQASRGTIFLKFGPQRHARALVNYRYMMSPEGAAFVEKYRAVGCTEAEKGAKAAALADALQEAFVPTTQFDSESRATEPRAHNVEKFKGRFTIRCKMHKKGAPKVVGAWPGTPCYDSEVAAAFDADVLQFRVAGAFGLGNLNFPEFSALYRDARRFNDDEYNFCLKKYMEPFANKDRVPCTVAGCDKTFAVEGALAMHIKNKHPEEYSKLAKWYCKREGCDKITTSERAMKRHVTDKHTQRRFPCTTEGCSRMFPNANSRQKHERLHREGMI
jgi:hypothetical protein